MFYFGQSPAGFYSTESHGERRVLIVDPEWSPPLKDGVPDESVAPRMIEVDNPFCLIPADAVPISDELYESLLSAPSRSKIVVVGPDGLPIEADPPPLSGEEAETAERFWRAARLALTDGMVSRHRDELEEGGSTTLTPEQYAELQAYRRQLRDWPASVEFPLIENRPLDPLWLSELLT